MNNFYMSKLKWDESHPVRVHILFSLFDLYFKDLMWMCLLYRIGVWELRGVCVCVWNENALLNHRITEFLGLEGISGDQSSSPTLCQARVTWSSLHGNTSRWGMNASRDGTLERNCTTSLGSLSQGSATLRKKEILPHVEIEFLVFMF